MDKIANFSVKTPSAPNFFSSPRLGQILEVSQDGRLYVTYKGNPHGLLLATCIEGLLKYDECIDNLPMSVLLVFSDNDPYSPIIVGKIADKLSSAESVVGELNTRQKTHSIFADGETVVFEAEKEILLKCGKSSVTLKKNGKVIVKGTEIISRSSGRNKLKGANVSIN